MGTEIERKYLVNQDKWRSHQKSLSVSGKKYAQGYIPTNDGATVRLRIIGTQGYLTIKGKTVEHTRSEFEYPIPLQDAQAILATLCLKPLIEKIRYKVTHSDLTWEVDEFLGENAGLMIAEVELSSEEQQPDLPEWVDQEVNDKKYFNSSLVKYPYSQWSDKV